MPIDYQALKSYPIPEVVQDLTRRDAMLYALSVGLGADPMDERQLRFVCEDGLAALPTMAVVLGYAGFWLKHPDTGVDWVKVVHGEQGLVLHGPLPVEGRLIGRTRVTEIVDKGPRVGALLYSARDVYDASGGLVCTLTMTAVCRGDGGFGGPNGPTPTPHPIPDRAPDLTVELPTLPQAALLYRLSGDYNPLHSSPQVAKAAGYPRPILHGLCTFGVVGHALLRGVCDYDASQIKSMAGRFSQPVFPGERIRTEIWRDGHTVSFRASAVERNVVVLNNGRADIV